jgi:predicted DNA binding CopG/RHH family protein
MKVKTFIDEEEYELPQEVDFRGGIRGRFYRPKKIPTTMRLDNDLLIFLKKRASELKIPYQTLVNSLLREYMQKEGLEP